MKYNVKNHERLKNQRIFNIYQVFKRKYFSFSSNNSNFFEKLY